MGTSKNISDEGGAPAFTQPDKLTLEDDRARYTHYKKGGTYRKVADGEMKSEAEGRANWRPSVTYQDVHSGKVYTCSSMRWATKFEVMPGPGYVAQGQD